MKNSLCFDVKQVDTPDGITNKVRKYKTESGSVEFIEQEVSLKIDDKFIATKVQENINNIKILFIFNFIEPTPYEYTASFFGSKSTIYAWRTKLDKVLLYNSKTNEVYYTY